MSKHSNRRTFCIVSHPDAGKTTLTEKLLLYGGAIHEAGTVKARKATRYATSDWMEIEKQRGISVTSSVMQFDYAGCRINLLDTPGHHDFSEDTYRVITAVDSALMVVDGAKGIEEQTKKLMKICSDRKLPVLTFINKFDRECLSPIQLLDEIESVLKIKCIPRTWPIGSGKSFKGIYHLEKKTFSRFDTSVERAETIQTSGLNDPRWDEWAEFDILEIFREQAELVSGIYGDFDRELYLNGSQSPVYFGSALNNFGIEILLSEFCEISPEPQARLALQRIVEPSEKQFTGFVFKIQANMDARHRDRIAFVRICSGAFEKGMDLYSPRHDRKFKISSVFQFLAAKRSHVEEAYAGDIVGLYDTGEYKIGDTLTEKEKLSFLGIPNFAPEHFRRVVLKTPLKSKQLKQGLKQLCEEGASQVFFPKSSNDIFVGVVGLLQFEVIQHRLENEYGAESKFEVSNFRLCRWVFPKKSADPKKIEEQLAELSRSYDTVLARDAEDRDAILCSSEYALNKARERFPDLDFLETSEMVSRAA